MEKEQSLSDKWYDFDFTLSLCICAYRVFTWKKLLKPNAAVCLLNIIFPARKPEGGGSRYNKWKLFAVCLINSTDKLLGFGSYVVVGSQAFGTQQQIMLFSIIALAFPLVFEAIDSVCAQKLAVPSRSKQEQ